MEAPANDGGASISTLGYALLGVLARGPRSAPELVAALANPVGFFWNALHTQIYPELVRLERAGLVTHELLAPRGRRSTKRYAATEAGRAALAAWASAPVPMDPDRSRFMLKVYSLWLAEPPAAAHLLREHERLHAERLATYEAIEAEMRRSGAAEEPVTSPRFAAYATLRRGIGYEREYVAWCRWLAERFEAAAGG